MATATSPSRRGLRRRSLGARHGADARQQTKRMADALMPIVLFTGIATGTLRAELVRAISYLKVAVSESGPRYWQLVKH